ncbi:LysM peptidoglycan-binding domain-containing protein [Listeria welshimeri]|uniref:LysM peptidoglycan-binding domain-containing protein n=1 Tax=Listeria welshimeri TaxID=1643 RepID=UPI001886C6A0|nr:LysM domain-containing protein [Listeria welshimeri]MBF2342544.1 LysM peptidoglycan-binding domain-containing protein [Listeria welshimeri]
MKGKKGMIVILTCAVTIAVFPAMVIANNNKLRTVEEVKADISSDEYTIRWGDTLSVIAEASNKQIFELKKDNKIANVDVIYANNKLKINTDSEALEATEIQNTNTKEAILIVEKVR